MSETVDTGTAEEITVKRKKKERKLLIQVGIIFAVIFILVIGISAFIQAKGNIQTYLEAKQEFMKPLTEKFKACFDDLGDPGFFFDIWLEYPEIEGWMLSDDDELYQEIIADFPIDEDSELSYPSYDPDKLREYTKRQQLLLAIYLHNDIALYQIISVYQMSHENVVVLDVSDKHWGSNYMDTSDAQKLALYGDDVDEFSFHLGEDYSEYLNSLKSIDIVRSTKQTVFERYDNPKDGKYYYLCISPIISDGEVRAVYIMSHDWSEFHSTLYQKLMKTIIYSGIVILAGSVLLLFFINRSAIRPLEKVMHGVRGYMMNKDSSSVVEKMDEIKQKNEFGVLADDVSQMVVEMDRYTDEISKLTGERERVAAELALAADIQAGFLPAVFPDEEDFELYASMKPAKEVGGDLYDFFDIDDTHIGLVIGDVSGKGVPASLFMMIAKLLIQEYGRSEFSPAMVLTKANNTLCKNNKNDMFVTAWFGVLDRTNGKIIAASAGHEFPIMKNPGGDFELIKDRHGFVLGGMEGSKFRDYELELKPGGTLLVYTDGAPEATNAGEELFGTGRMLTALNAHKEDHPKELMEHLTEAINEFVGDAPQFDDLTMLCIRYNGWKEAKD